MSNYEEWSELFKAEVQSHLELILQNDYDEHYYASYLKSLEDNQQEEHTTTSNAREIEETEIVNKQPSIQTELIAVVLLCCVLVWLSLRARQMWKNKSKAIESTKELPYFHTPSTV